MGGIQGYDGFVSVDLIYEYQKQGLKTLDLAREECERAIEDMTPVFGELHFILLDLYTARGYMLDELGELSKSKVLRMQIREKTKKTNGTNRPRHLLSILNVLRSHKKLGEWVEAQILQEEVLKNVESTNSKGVESIKHSLAFTSGSLGDGRRPRSWRRRSLRQEREYLAKNIQIP